MLAPDIWMVGNGRVLGIHPAGRSIEQMKPFAGDARDNFRRDATPRKCFADAKQSAGPCDRSEYGFCIERLHRAEIDHFDFVTFGAELFRDRESFVEHRAITHEREVTARPDDSRLPDRHPLLGESVSLEMV